MGRGLAPNGEIYYLSLSINPLGQTGASRSALRLCKRERGRLRKMGASQMKREIGKDIGLARSGALGQNKTLCGWNRTKTNKMLQLQKMNEKEFVTMIKIGAQI